jgi:hypothetical protein
MSNVASPFGLKPAFHPSGILRQQQSTIISGFGTTIFQFSPVRIDDATGALIPAVAGATNILGVFAGVEFTRTDGRRAVANNWEANTVATEIVAYYVGDPMTIYEIQGDGPVLQANVGDMADYNALAGNTTTGLSSVSLATAGLSAAAASLRVVGINPAADNVVGDAFTIAQVQIAEHAWNLYVEVKT